jgi:hypothetical protein
MNCKKAREIIVLDHYGEAGADDKARLAEHVQKCAACAAELAETRRLFALLDAQAPEPVPTPDWERAWRGVEAAMAGSEARKRDARPTAPAPAPSQAPPLRWRWAWAAPALATVLVAGILIGRFALGPGRPGPDASGIPMQAIVPAATLAGTPAAGGNGGPNGIRPAFSAHLDDLKPLLLDYTHYIPGQSLQGRAVVDEAALRALMLQNVLLKRKLAEKDPAAADLLDDLDLVLKEILNRDPKNAKSPAEIRDLIEKRDIMFKMEILKKT